MSFQYSAIGDNTPENREHLEKLGYKPNYMYDKEGVLYTRNDISNYYVGFIENIKHECVNCIGNDPLFQAVSAMRDDSDKGWLINKTTGAWLFCHEDCITWMLGGGSELYHRKPTIAELQSHFQRV